jgi:molybdopterin synthase sulfur carrier subunit
MTDPAAPCAVRLLLFAAARQAAGLREADMSAVTVGDLMEQARARFGPAFGAVLDGCRVWVNGEPADFSDRLASGDEVAVLPPVSGG